MGIPILGANSASDAYDISNSLRFNDDDSAKLSRTFDSGGSRKKFTFSTWVKRANLGQEYGDLFGTNLDSGESAGSKSLSIGFTSSNTFTIDSDTGAQLSLSTSRVFRDPSAWYHFVVAVDTTQGTASNRIKLYVNGVQETLTGNQPSQNLDTAMGRASEHTIGADYNSFFDGYMSEIYYVNDQQYDPTYFGKFDNNGEWIPVEPGTGAGGSITYGTNGFLLEFKQTGTSQNSSGIGADTSGNDNHLAVTNIASTDSALADTCTNNFCTLNPVAVKAGGETNYTSRIVKANLGADTTNNSDSYSFFGTMPTDMPFYYELKFLDVHASGNDIRVGISREEMTYQSGSHAEAHYRNSGDIHSFASDGSNVASANSGNQSFSDNDIIGVAADNTTNNNVKFYHNGTLQATIDIDANELYQPYVRLYGNSTETEFSINFGNPHYSISSGNSDANGYGNFEYAVPSGYYALCTKNLAEYG